MWKEHRLWGKNVPYDAAVRVPLAMHVPASLGGEIANPDDLILNIDLAPTAAALAGAEPQNPIDGRSFLGRLDGTDTSWRAWVILEHAEGGLAPAYCAARSTTGLSFATRPVKRSSTTTCWIRSSCTTGHGRCLQRWCRCDRPRTTPAVRAAASRSPGSCGRSREAGRPFVLLALTSVLFPVLALSVAQRGRKRPDRDRARCTEHRADPDGRPASG